MNGAEALTDDATHFIPDGRAAKMCKLAGKYEIDGKRHLNQVHAGAGIPLVSCVIAALLGKRHGDHA